MMEISGFSPEDFDQKISNFVNYINEITLKNSELSLEERRLKISETLKFDYFLNKLRIIFGPELDESYCKGFFKKISHNPDCLIDWSELFGYNDENENKNVDSKNSKEKSVDKGFDEVQIFMAPFRFRIGDASGEKARRDTIQSIHYAHDIDSFITVAQKGAVSVWNSKLKLNGCTFLKEQYDGWLNGCCYLPNIKRVVISAERCLSLWDFRNNKQQKSVNNKMIFRNMLTIQGMTGLTCLDTINKLNQHRDSDKLIMGDSFGNIMTMEININDLSSNNTRPDPMDPSRRLIDFDTFRNSIIKKKVHDEPVTKIQFISELNCFISCSSSEKVSLVIEELYKFENKDLRINRQVGITKGCNTFCYCSKVNLIATGGVDKSIRLFNPLVINKTCGKLLGHLFTIVDLVCNEKDQQLISLSSERVFRVWDLTTFKCLQVFSDTETRPGEKRIFCLSFDQKRDRLLTCSSVLDCWPLTRSIQDTMLPPHTHDRPITAISYSENQMATLCTESTIKVWEGDTGRLLYVIKKAHGQGVNTVCMTIDPSGFRLAAAGSDGSLKIWNFGTGQELKSKPGIKDVESKIISVHYGQHNNDLLLFVCDLNNIIKVYQDSIDSNELNLICVLGKNMGKSLSLSKFEVIPPILSEGTNEDEEPEKPKITNEQSALLSNHQINASLFNTEHGILITASKYLVIWNAPNQELKEIFGVKVDDEAENLNDSDKNCFQSNVMCIKLLTNKRKKVEFSETIVEYDLESCKNDQSSESEKDHQDNKSSYSRKSSIATLTENEKIEDEKKEFDPIQTFKYIIVTGHEDGVVKFWNEQGEIINELPPIGSIKQSPITSISIDPDRKFIYTGDSNGYIVMWSIHDFLEDFDLNAPIDLNENSLKITMVVCWRGHMNKIVGLVYIPQEKILLSASLDESVRGWCANKGKYIGFLGQTKPLKKPMFEPTDWVAPYDITELPIYFNKSKVAQKPIEKNYEYPLILDKKRLNNRSLVDPIKSLKLPQLSSVNLNESHQNGLFPNERYFSALVKPKHSFNENDIQVRSVTYEGSIFSSLPLYRETTSLGALEFKSLLLTNPHRPTTKEATVVSNEKPKGPKVNFKLNVKVIR